METGPTELSEGWDAAVDMAVAGSGPGERRRRAEIVEMIRDLLTELDLRPGDRLPSERQLASRFGVGRGSVREGIQFLAIMGLVEVRHGGGTYLRSPVEANSHVRHWWRQWVVEHRGKVLETLEARLGMEAFAAGLAAQRARPRDLERLVHAMHAMREVCSSGPVDTARFVECDVSFHDTLLEASGNATLRGIIYALSEELLPERAAVTELEGRAHKTYREHYAIYEAVRAGDTQMASEAMTRHITSVRQDVLGKLLDQQEREDAGATSPRGGRDRNPPASVQSDCGGDE